MNKDPISNNPEFVKRINKAKAAFTAWDKKHKDHVNPAIKHKNTSKKVFVLFPPTVPKLPINPVDYVIILSIVLGLSIIFAVALCNITLF